MNRTQAKKVLQMLERINQEIDLLGNVILNKGLKHVPIPVKDQNIGKFK